MVQALISDVGSLKDEVRRLRGIINATHVGGFVNAGAITGVISLSGVNTVQHLIANILAIPPTDLTIAGGVITITGSHHRVDTEFGDPSDDLDTINGFQSNQVLIIRPVDDARTIVIKHGAGNILCVGNSDITLDDQQDFAILLYDPVALLWYAQMGAATVHSLLDGSVHNDTVAQAVSRGSLLYGNSTPKWDELAVGGANTILGSDGTDAAWRAQSFIDHGSLSGLADDDHAQYALSSSGYIMAVDPPARYINSFRLIGSASFFILQSGGGGPGSTFEFDVNQSALDHGSISGLADDDHTQYALLAGRAGGQTLIGGTGSGESLILQSTSHATRGFITHNDAGRFIGAVDETAAGIDRIDIGVASGTPRMIFEDAGQTIWEIDNSAGAFRWFTPGVVRVNLSTAGMAASGYFRAGSVSAPANTTAGDATVVRLMVGANTTFGSGNGTYVHVSGALTDTAAGSRPAVFFNAKLAPVANSSSEFRTLYFQGLLTPATTVTMANVRGGYFELRNRSDAAVTILTGVFSAPLVIDGSSPATVGNVTLAVGVDAQLYGRPSGTSIVSVTDLVGFRTAVITNAGLTAGTLTHFLARNPTGSTFTTQIGLDIEALTRATTNIGIRNASPTVFTPSAAQNITAAGTTLLANATIIQLTADASYVLTSAPTIADGQDGQVLTIVNVDTVDTITLQDQGTLASSSLRLNANRVALGPRDSITLIYSSTVGDWIQRGPVNGTVPYAAYAKRTATQALSDAVATKIQLNAEDFDVHADFDSVTNYRFVAPVAGKYQVNCHIQAYKSGGTAGLFDCAGEIWVDGSLYQRVGRINLPSLAENLVQGIAGGLLLNLAAGSYVELYCYIDVNDGTPTIYEATLDVVFLGS